MESLSESTRILLVAIGVPVAFALAIIPSAFLLKKFGPALHRATMAELSDSGEPTLWPRPRNREQAARACRQAAWLPFLFASFSVLLSLAASSPAGLIDAAILLVCGFGLRRCSRVAALVALALYLLGVAESYRQLGFFNPLALLYIGGLAWGVFVAFRFHSLPANDPAKTAAA